METLKEFNNILLGYKVEVYIDHKNLTYETKLNDYQGLQRWQSLIQEFDLTLKFITSKINIIADAISILQKEQHETPVSQEQQLLEAELCALLELNNLYITEMAECFSIDNKYIDSPLVPHLVEVE